VSSPILPNPDITGYVDLRIFDITDQEMVNTAIANLLLNLPGWVPNEANIEMVIIESLALVMAEGIVAINRLPGAVTAAILAMAGVTQDIGAPPTATATITFGDTIGHTVPGGTRVLLPQSDGSAITFLVEPPGVTVLAGSSSGVASIIGDTYTAIANGTPSGTELIMADRLPFVESVALATAVANGADPETDNQWRDRGVARLARLSDALVTPGHFVSAALETEGVAAAVGLDLWDGSGGAPGDDPGHMTVAVLGDGGVALSAPAKAALATSLEGRAVAILTVHVIDVTVVTVNVATTVVLRSGFDPASVTAAIQGAVTSYLDPLAWTGGATIYLNEMISLVDQVTGVDRVTTVTLAGSAANYTMSGYAALPDAGTITVTAT
jgi:uncharacterized phage protein gp47/JayE